jgi:hypothetical protein
MGLIQKHDCGYKVHSKMPKKQIVGLLRGAI